MGMTDEIVARGWLHQLVDELWPNHKVDGIFAKTGDPFGGKGESTHMTMQGEFAGRWTDWQSGERGDIIDLFAKIKNDGSVKDAIKELTRRGLLPTPAPTPYELKRIRRNNRIQRRKRRMKK